MRERAVDDAADAQRKALETVRAVLALRGYELRRAPAQSGGATFIVRRCAFERGFADLAAVAAFADRDCQWSAT